MPSLMAASTERTVPSVKLVHASRHVDGSVSGKSWGLCDRCFRVRSHRPCRRETPPPNRLPLPDFPPIPVRSSVSRRMPRESLDAPEDLPNQALRQVAPGQLEPDVPGMSHETPAGLEELAAAG